MLHVTINTLTETEQQTVDPDETAGSWLIWTYTICLSLINRQIAG